MSLNDPLSDALININNSESATKKSCIIKPASKLIINVLKVLQNYSFIEEFEVIDDKKSGIIKVSLNGSINECKPIKPRHAVKLKDFEKYEKRFLPAKDIGIIIVSTPKGVTSHKKAIELKSGGRLLAFVY